MDKISMGKCFTGSRKPDLPGAFLASKNIIRLSSYFLSHISMVIVREGARTVIGYTMTSFHPELRTGTPSSERPVRKYRHREAFSQGFENAAE